MGRLHLDRPRFVQDSGGRHLENSRTAVLAGGREGLPMTKLRVQSLGISIDGYAAGPCQDLQNPLGVRGPELMEWLFNTRFFRKMHGNDGGGETGVDDKLD